MSFIATIVKEWVQGSVSIAVETGKDDMNQDGTHVHIYKRGHRTKSRIPRKNYDLDNKDFDIAEELYYRNLLEIETLCEAVKKGLYDG